MLHQRQRSARTWPNAPARTPTPARANTRRPQQSGPPSCGSRRFAANGETRIREALPRGTASKAAASASTSSLHTATRQSPYAAAAIAPPPPPSPQA
eukprot:6182135-Pleurochrysis_carterae.AAC.1